MPPPPSSSSSSGSGSGSRSGLTHPCAVPSSPQSGPRAAETEDEVAFLLSLVLGTKSRSRSWTGRTGTADPPNPLAAPLPSPQWDCGDLHLPRGAEEDEVCVGGDLGNSDEEEQQAGGRRAGRMAKSQAKPGGLSLGAAAEVRRGRSLPPARPPPAAGRARWPPRARSLLSGMAPGAPRPRARRGRGWGRRSRERDRDGARPPHTPPWDGGRPRRRPAGSRPRRGGSPQSQRSVPRGRGG